MSRWIHVDFYFNTEFKDGLGKYGKYLNLKQQVMFEKCLANIIQDCRKYIKRKFYLYEPEPHCFLALEINRIWNMLAIRRIINKHSKLYSFIQSAKINTKATSDDANGEDFLIILDAFTEAYLFHREQKLTHIVHCCMEFIHQTRIREITFYQEMLALYGGDEWR